MAVCRFENAAHHDGELYIARHRHETLGELAQRSPSCWLHACSCGSKMEQLSTADGHVELYRVVCHYSGLLQIDDW